MNGVPSLLSAPQEGWWGWTFPFCAARGEHNKQLILRQIRLYGMPPCGIPVLPLPVPWNTGYRMCTVCSALPIVVSSTPPCPPLETRLCEIITSALNSSHFNSSTRLDSTLGNPRSVQLSSAQLNSTQLNSTPPYTIPPRSSARVPLNLLAR